VVFRDRFVLFCELFNDFRSVLVNWLMFLTGIRFGLLDNLGRPVELNSVAKHLCSRVRVETSEYTLGILCFMHVRDVGSGQRLA